MDENNDVYFALAFDETNLPTGHLLFDAADFNGNYFSGAKDIPDGGFGNGKYYYGDLELAFNLHRDMPVVTDINSAPVWPNAYDFYIVGNGTTISGNSEDYSFYPGESGTITLTGNGTASKVVNSSVNSFIHHRGLPCDLTITLGSDYTIFCPNTDTAINMYNKGFLKLATTGGTQTLTVSVKGNTTKGLVGTNYTGTQAASALAADGFIVTLANSSPTANSDGIYTYVYTVTPVTIDLASITSDYTAIDGQVLTGTLGENVKISIADGATVTLSGVNINGSGTWTSGNYAGLTCLGDATIILADGTTNTVRGFQLQFPGIFVPGDKNNASNNKTLTIKGGTLGSGSLNASSSGNAPGIGSANGSNAERAGGNIIIQGGTINATGGNFSAGIGSSDISKCGNITISGGNVTATGGQYGAGIGSGYGGSSTHSICGDILISGGTVEATGGEHATGIGTGWHRSDCGDITISGGTVQATGGNGAAGIGTGFEESNTTDPGTSICGNITFSGGTITATCGANGLATVGRGNEKGTTGDIAINYTTSMPTPTITLNNTNNDENTTPVFVNTFMNVSADKDVSAPYVSGMQNMAFSEFGYSFENDEYHYTFSCPVNAQHFVFKPNTP